MYAHGGKDGRNSYIGLVEQRRKFAVCMQVLLYKYIYSQGWVGNKRIGALSCQAFDS